MSDTHIKGILWTFVGALLFFWFFSLAVNSFYNSEHNPTVYHYKVCPAPTGGSGGR